jgi:flavin reductase (DIM6/NTAB) family NADH-FMN oxidoreductase RutF
MQDAGLDVRALRNALGHYTTGVTIVTTLTPEGEHTGVTVNSFTSVSLEPPLVLFCLATRSSLRAAFEQAGHFVVNVLAKGQQACRTSSPGPHATRGRV